MPEQNIYITGHRLVVAKPAALIYLGVDVPLY